MSKEVIENVNIRYGSRHNACAPQLEMSAGGEYKMSKLEWQPPCCQLSVSENVSGSKQKISKKRHPSCCQLYLSRNVNFGNGSRHAAAVGKYTGMSLAP
jgi:hypothetical protein